MSFLRHPRKLWWRNALFQIHLWLGIGAGIYFLLIGFTGSLIVYKKELERAMIPRLIRVAPQQSKAGLQAMYDAVRSTYPKATINNVYLYPEGLSWSFRLSHNQERVQVYVDPYTGSVLGEDRYEGKFLQWVYEFHVHLLAGETGDLVNGIGGLAMAAMALTGLIIWWPGANCWRNALRFARSANWKRKNYDLHKLCGLASALFLVVLGLTGSYWTWPQEYEAILAWVTQGPAKTSPPTVPAAPRGQWQNLDAILAAARTALPEGEPTLFRFASRPGDTHSLKRVLPQHWRTQGDDTVYLDPVTAQVVRLDFHAEQPLGVRLQRDLYALHFGTFGGTFTRLVWVVVGVAPGMLFFTGLLMYRNRVLVKRSRQWNVPVARTITS